MVNFEIFHFEVAALLRDEYFAAACDLKIEEEEGKLFRRNLLSSDFFFYFYFSCRIYVKIRVI